jgi:Leucine-rich repeat (LRR) protein
LINRIEGLDTMTKLVTLNLSHNRITKVENLEELISLKNIDLSHNRIIDLEGIKGLKDRPTLTSVDL